MPTNTGAWLEQPKQYPFAIKPSPYVSPAQGEILVRNRALAINPVDWKIQDTDMFSSKYPTILGEDLAGEVEEVGPGVTRFKKGDRVLGYPAGLITGQIHENGFQEYTIIHAHMAAHIPASVSFEDAAVIPLGAATAAAGLFQKDFLALQHPAASGAASTGKTVLIWGGSSSVGVNGIQLAKAAGYDVIATASPRNFDYLKKLGADAVYDYNSKTVVDELVDAFKGKTCAGVLDCVTINGVCEMCAEIVGKTSGEKFVAAVLPPPEDKMPKGAAVKWIFALTIKDNDVAPALFEGYIEPALAKGSFVAAPEPVVAGKGIGEVQKAVEAHKKGVSAKKVVLSM